MAASLVQSIMQNIFGANTAYSKSSNLSSNSVTLTGGTISSSKSVSYNTLNTRYETVEMYDFVEDYHLTQAILTVLQSFISDMYADAELKCSIDLDKRYEWYANTVIKNCDIKKNVLDNLHNYLYRGQQGKYLDHKICGLRPLVDSTNFAIYFESDVPKMAMVKSNSSLGSRLVRYYNGLWLQYKPEIVKAFTKYDNRNKDLNDKDLYYENDFRIGTSIFRGAILKLYSMFVKEYLADQMALKEALKNEVLVANIQDEDTDIKDISQATEMISKLVNDEESMSILSHSPDALLRLIDEKLVTYINVVPGIQNFTNFDKMELFSLRDKLNMLREDIDADEDRVLKTLGISKDLMNGDGTKYDAIERSTRFVTLLKFINSGIIDSLKKFVASQIFFKFGVDIPEDSIKFNTDTAAILTNVDTSYKFKVLQEIMQAVNDSANAYKDLTSNDAVDDDKAYEFYSKKLSAIDANLVGLIKKIEPEDASGDNTGNSSSSW